MADTTPKHPEWLLRLAADLLREYSERLSNDGCNDFDIPAYVPAPELVAIMRGVDGYETATLEDWEAISGLNHFVAEAVADALSPEELL